MALLRLKLRFLCLLATASVVCAGADAFQFTVGDFYATNSTSLSISRYDQAGFSRGHLFLNPSFGTEVRGVTFGNNGLLYAVTRLGTGFKVIGMDQTGQAIKSYSGTENLSSNPTAGKIAIGLDSSLYVCAGNTITVFTRGSQTGSTFFTQDAVRDIKTLPSGNLLVLSSNSLKELSPQGVVLRTIQSSISFTAARSVEYDAVSNSIFVAGNGGVNPRVQLLKLNAMTGEVLATQVFQYGDDMHLTADRRLLATARFQSLGIFDMNLVRTATFGNAGNQFITQMPVPEPSLAGVLLFGAFAALRRKFKSK